MKKLFTSFAMLILLIGSCYAEISEITKKSYELINIDKVRDDVNPITNKQRWDGSGVTVGIVDSSINSLHPSLDGSNLGQEGYRFPYELTDHGTHVAGLLLGKKFADDEPYGIAHNAKFYNYAFLGENNKNLPNAKIYGFFKNKKDVKIINNSWGASSFPLINGYFRQSRVGNFISYDEIDSKKGFNTPISLNDFSSRIQGNYANQLVALSKENGVLNVFANGNQGNISPATATVVPSYDENIRSWLAVGNINPLNTIKKDDGSIEITNNYKVRWNIDSVYYKEGVDGSMLSSNLFVGSAANYGIMAPGFEIEAANAAYLYRNAFNGRMKYIPMTGTSMASPIVSGAAALVQQKYPFLNGAQVADVLLTTANDNVKLPKLFLKQSDSFTGYYVIYTDPSFVPRLANKEIDINQVKDDLLAIGVDDYEANRILRNPYTDNLETSILALSKEEIIGQGILDVEKALKGLARLDANRLNNKDIYVYDSTKKEFKNLFNNNIKNNTLKGNKVALYTIDTGTDSALVREFSNDIDQRLWKDSLHLDGALNSPKDDMKFISQVGLKKQGLGTLILSGKNTYKGATIAEGGTLSIANQIAGDGYAINGATLKLDGSNVDNLENGTVKIGGNVYIKNKNSILEILNKANISGFVETADNGKIGIRSTSNLKTSSLIVDNSSLEAIKDSSEIDPRKLHESRVINIDSLNQKGNFAINGVTIDVSNSIYTSSARPAPVKFNINNSKLRIGGNGIFKGYNENDTLAISGDAIFDTTKDTSFASKAKILGDGKFIKQGVGNLVLNSNKNWIGGTEIHSGNLVLKGDFKLNDGEKLGIGIINDTKYSKLIADNVNITNGILQIITPATNDVSLYNKNFNPGTGNTGKTIREIIKSELSNRVGEFKEIDRSKVDSKYIVKADYSSNDAVHLNIFDTATYADPANPDPANPDPANPDPANPDPANPDPANPDPANPDPANPDPANPDPANPDPANPDPANPDPANPDPANPDPANPDPANPDPANPDPANPDPANPDPANPDPANPDPANPDPANPDPANPDPANPDPANPDPANPDPANPDPANPDPANPDPANPDPANPDPANPDPANPDPANPDPANPDPANPDPANPDPANPDPANPDPANPDPANPDPANPDPANPDPANPDPANPDPANPDPANPDPANPDPANPVDNNTHFIVKNDATIKRG
ncbi:S8 family serine peptidase [Campylobacter corcagiensis]|uniref:S8 family serine peptidase n=1 Tax=Campylobacter corcagiensis TaxID=1448857 RepID=A0A7M1LIB8_9BACT|nr:S8 family serine peptidase [Campylobacter corcagiensis]QOQ87616.1 S8 family serine peptidase [Campylobacter corcagiensis]